MKRQRAEAVAHFLEDLIIETGFAGPFLIGSMLCDLCGLIDHVIVPARTDKTPKELRIFCPNCGQKQMEFMDLEADSDFQ